MVSVSRQGISLVFIAKAKNETQFSSFLFFYPKAEQLEPEAAIDKEFQVYLRSALGHCSTTSSRLRKSTQLLTANLQGNPRAALSAISGEEVESAQIRYESTQIPSTVTNKLIATDHPQEAEDGKQSLRFPSKAAK